MEKCEASNEIRRQMDDEITYASQGTYSPSYMAGVRDWGLTVYFEGNPDAMKAHEVALAEAWEARKSKKISDRHGNELCRGFLATRIDRGAGAVMETRYARLNDGTVLMSEERKAPCHDFNRPDSTWTPVDAVPVGAEFIGNYPLPC